MKLLVIALLLVCVKLCVVTTAEGEKEDAQPRIGSLMQTDKIVLQKSEPYKKPDDKSFMSKLAGWLFPFGSDEPAADSIPDDTRHVGQQYLPAQKFSPQKNANFKANCHPCNREPWIPIAMHRGKNAVISFVQPSKLNVQASSSVYGPPPITNFGTLSNTNNFGPPTNIGSKPNTNYGPPSLSTSYGPPPSNSGHGIPNNNQGLPNSNHAFQHYGPPSIPSSSYGAPNRIPNSNYGPPGISYDSPPSTKYGVPQASVHQPQIHKYRPSNLNVPSSGTAFFKFSGPPKDYIIPPPFPNYLPSKSPTKYVPAFGPTKIYLSSSIDVPKPPPPGPPILYGPPQSPPPVEYTIKHYRHNQQGYQQHFDDTKYLPNEPIPLPNLSASPLAPLHGAQNFQDQRGSEVEIVQSVPIADYIASIQHPINVIQSPLVDVTVNEEQQGQHDLQNGLRLSENPIVVDDDVDAAASDKNITYDASNVNKRGNEKDLGAPNQSAVDIGILENLLKENGISLDGGNYSKFTPPPVDYNNWSPSVDEISTSMLPPPVGKSPWLSIIDPTKKTKQIQIIIPYITNNGNNHDDYVDLNGFGKLPSHEDPVWPRYVGEESKTFNSEAVQQQQQTTKSTTPLLGHGTSPQGFSNNNGQNQQQFYNIRDLLKGEVDLSPVLSNNLPYDIITLQKNIDDWTQQEYLGGNFDSATTKLMPSKKIPKEYLMKDLDEDSTENVEDFGGFPSGSSNKESKLVDDNFETNFIIDETTPIGTTTDIVTPKPSLPTGFAKTDDDKEPKWDQTLLAISPVTKEKVYVVTPQPLKTETKPDWSYTPDNTDSVDQVAFSSSSLSVRVADDAKNQTGTNESLKVVYSEWPHLINNLQTTTSTTEATSSRHPLFGLMDLPSHLHHPPSNSSTVQTYSGHSKVLTVVTTTQSGVAKKKSTSDGKKTTPKTASTASTA